MAWPVRRIFRLCWWCLCTLTLCALPLTIWEFKNHGFAPQYQGWFIGGIFVILTIPISVYEVAIHTEYYTRPRLQRHVIRILWMVPIYSVDAWLAMRFKDARIYLDPIRECYEAYVIYNFYAYLMNFLEDELGNVEEYCAKKASIQHVWPLRLVLGPWRMGSEFLWETKKGVVTYVILRPLCTALTFITDRFGKYEEGSLAPNVAYPYLAFVINCSQMYALYCLVMFYQAFHDELSPIRPLSKFIVIKAVVFLTFWQGLFLNILVALGIITVKEQFTTWTATDVAEGLQNFLICIEMFLAALAHAYAFPPRDYMDANIPTKGFFTNVRYMFDLRDVVVDVQDVIEDHLVTTTTTGRKALKKTVEGVVQTPGQIYTMFTTGQTGPKRQGSDDSRHTALLDMEEASGRIHRRTSSGASDRALTSAAQAGTSSDPLGEEPASEPTDSETAPFVRRHRS